MGRDIPIGQLFGSCVFRLPLDLLLSRGCLLRGTRQSFILLRTFVWCIDSQRALCVAGAGVCGLRCVFLTPCRFKFGSELQENLGGDETVETGFVEFLLVNVLWMIIG